MRKSKSSNPYTGFDNLSISIIFLFIYDLRKVKTFDRPSPHIYNHPILVCPSFCCTTMNVHNWIQKDPPPEKQSFDISMYLYIAFFFAKAHNVYKFYKNNKTDRKANTC